MWIIITDYHIIVSIDACYCNYTGFVSTGIAKYSLSQLSVVNVRYDR